MNENLNLVEILKDYPSGTKLYSLIYGEVELVNVLQNNVTYPIEIRPKNKNIHNLTKDGRMFVDYDGECILFPSKYERDWSKFNYKTKELVHLCKFKKFKVGDKIVNILMRYMGGSGSQGIISEITDDKYIFTDGSFIYISDQDSWELLLNRFDPKTLKPFDKVLVRDSDVNDWSIQLFSYIKEYDESHPYACIFDNYRYCIPYNDDTKNLVGTIEEAPVYYRYWED